MKHSSTSNDARPELKLALEAFVALLLRWNRAVNLIARADEAQVRERHIGDALQLVPLIPPDTARAIDLGSGAGFPGLILALATGIFFDLIEADARKAAFLREAARLTGAPVQVHACRIEEIALRPAPLVTARALARLPDLLDLAAPKLESGGAALFPKGMNIHAELTDAAAKWHMILERIPSRTAPGSSILRITDLHRVPPPA
ncbi:MAG: 16S rRNA (guanine(527)-N(7))-methyltransferase RsmG [Pseudomonadota bacterium]|nr:16S rRNA (guanine(527)-N(7))-methyltransferase RsmG [Pseudomonadota bacterium]